MSKVVEKVVSRQLNEHLIDQGLLPSHQSAYRKYHSTETAMRRHMSDALTAADQRRVTLIGSCWILSSAFDCVDHSLLLQRLQRTCGLSGMALRWLTSYVIGRSQQVVYGGQLSPIQSVQFRVRQGSVLGRLLFVLQYTADLSRVVANHGYSSSCSSTLTTVKSTSARQSTMLQRRSSDCPAVLTTLEPG